MTKFWILLSSFLFATSVFAADVVDTVGDAGSSCDPCDYSSLKSALDQDLDLVTNTDNHTIELYEIEEDWLLTSYLLSGWTTSPTYKLTIKGADSDRTATNTGKWSTERHRIIIGSSTSSSVEIRDDNVEFDGIQISGHAQAWALTSSNGAQDLVFRNSILWKHGTGGQVYWQRYNYSTVTFINNVIKNENGTCIYIYQTGSAELYFNTVHATTNGLQQSSGTTMSANGNIVQATDGFNGTITGDYNISSTVGDWVGTNGKAGTTITFIDSANEDYHVAITEFDHSSCGDGTAGCDETTFTDDIDGFVRPTGWDIGADQQRYHVSVGDSGSSCAPDCDYSALVTALSADLDIASRYEGHTIELYEMAETFTVVNTVLGWTTDSSYQLTVSGADSDKTATNTGKFSTERYRVTASAIAPTFNLQQDYINFEYFQIQNTKANGVAVRFSGIGTFNGTFDGMILETTGSSGSEWCIDNSGGTWNFDIWHTVCSGGGAGLGFGMEIPTSSFNIYFSTVTGYYWAVYNASSGTLNINGVVIQDTTDAVFGTVGGDYNLSSTSEAPGANSIASTVYTFEGSRDWHAAASETDHLDCGDDSTGCDETSHYYDIDGNPRLIQWDIGVDQTADDNIFTVGDSGSTCDPCDYSTLASVMGLDLNLIAFESPVTIECYEMEDTTAIVSVNGWTTSTTYGITIKGADSDRTATNTGKWSTERYRLNVAGWSPILGIADENITLKFLQLKSSYNAGQLVKLESGSNNFVLDGCYLELISGNGVVFYQNSTNTHGVHNSVFKCGGTGFGIIQNNGTGTLGFNTVYNCDSGAYRETGGTVTATGNIVQLSAESWFGTFSGDYNLQDGTDADMPGVNSLDSTTITFVDATNGDFHAMDTENDHLDCGDDSTGCDQALYMYDIDGEERTTKWDIGADEGEFVAGEDRRIIITKVLKW